MNKRELFPLYFRTYNRVPTRSELYWLRSHLVGMKAGLERSISPYAHVKAQAESTKLSYLLADLNSTGLNLWPIRLTTNIRISHSRSALKTLSSRLHIILKDYP